MIHAINVAVVFFFLCVEMRRIRKIISEICSVLLHVKLPCFHKRFLATRVKLVSCKIPGQKNNLEEYPIFAGKKSLLLQRKILVQSSWPLLGVLIICWQSWHLCSWSAYQWPSPLTGWRLIIRSVDTIHTKRKDKSESKKFLRWRTKSIERKVSKQACSNKVYARF